MNIDPARIARILIINPFGIGDVLFSTPLVARVRRLFPSAKIGFLCNRRVFGVLQRNSDIDLLWVLERDEFRAFWRNSKRKFFQGLWNLYREIRAQQFDIAFDLSLSNQFGFFLATMGVPYRLGFRYRNRGKFLNAALRLDGYQERHVAEHQLGLLDLLGMEMRTCEKIGNHPHTVIASEAKQSGLQALTTRLLRPYGPRNDKSVIFSHVLKGDISGQRLVYNATDEDRQQASALLHSLGVLPHERPIGIAPGGGDTWGSNAHYKRWNPHQFAQLCRLLMQNGQKLLFLGGREDRPIVEGILQDLSAPVASVAGQCPIEVSAALMLRCQMLIANDGGLLHLAVAQDVPTVSFFGPTDDAVYGPFPKSSRHLVFAKKLPCRPCYKNFRMPTCPYDKKCLEDWKAEEVFQKIQQWRCSISEALYP